MDFSGVKGLFNKQKDDPLFLERQKKTRNALLKNLSRAVKEVQLLYTRTQDGVLSDCRPVQRLCARFEDVLRSELKARWLGKSSGKVPSFWPVVLKISRKQAIEYINRLQYAQSDSGKCRAWIRLAANECSLESYISVICQDSNLLNQYYEIHSFLRDEETVSAMKQLLTGVSQISFNITVDTASLEFATAPEALQPALRIRAPLPMEDKGDTAGQISSTSTPQISSSSESSWRTNSSSSSFTHYSTHSNKDSIHSNKDKEGFINEVEIIKMSDGLEASIHHDDDSVVIDTPGLIKTDNLRRFSLALEDTNDDWMIHDEQFNEEMGTDRTSGAIFMKIPDDSEKRDTLVIQEEQTLDISQSDTTEPPLTKELPPPGETSPSLDPTSTRDLPPGETPPSQDPPSTLDISSTLEPGYEDSQVQSDSSSSSPLPTDTLKSSLLNVQSDSQDTLSQHIVRTTINSDDVPIKEENSNHQTKEPLQQNNQIDDLSDDEYTFNEILRLATGVKSSSSSSRSLSVIDTEERDTKQASSNSGTGLSIKKSSQFVDPYDGPNDNTTPKIDNDSNNPFISSPTTPVIHNTNPFLEGYVEPESPSFTAAVVANFGNPFNEEDASHDATTPCYQPIEETFGTFGDTQSPTSYSNPFNDDVPSENISTDMTDNKIMQQETLVIQGSPLISSERRQLSAEDIVEMVLKENHYTTELSVEEIDVKVSKLKVYLKNDSSNLDLQRALIQLQLMKQKKLEAEEEESILGGEVIFGHTFQEVRKGVTGKRCDICSKPILPLLKKCYQCVFCGQLSHEKCLRTVTRKCVSQALKDQIEYVIEIRPEKGLTYQHFRCECCNQALNTSSVEVRLCDYTGLYYCSDCHHNNLSLIPARILHNWDFRQQTVCCGCAELLNALEIKPLINIESINPSLYKYIQDITGVEVLRRDILLLKPLLIQCDRAKEERLIQELDLWPHFKDTANMYSLKDLIGLQNGTLLPQIQTIHKMYTSHVNDECETCVNSCKSCCICKSSEKLFKFSKDTVSCSKCLAVFHKHCSPNNTKCPACTKSRKSIFSTMFN